MNSKMISEQEIYKKLTYQNMIMESIFNSTQDLLFYKDYTNDEGVYMGCNDAFAALVGRTKEEIIGKNDFELFDEEVGAFFREKDRIVIENKASMINDEWVTYPDGREVLLSTQKSLFQDPDKKIIGIMGISRDITREHHYKSEIEKQMEKNEILANTDSLTGIANRRYFFEIAEKMLNRACREKNPLTLMMIDIDFFKKVNDTYGHIVGDHALKYVAKILQTHLREDDVLCRFGGEEFIVLLPNISLEKGIEIAERIRIYFAENDWHYDHTTAIPIKISIGAGVYEKKAHLRDFIHKVDQNLYHAKQKGRNRVIA